MAENQKENQGLEDVTVDRAYEVFNALNEAVDRVVTKPDMTRAFLMSLQTKYPDILDALMTVVEEEHREIVGRLIKSVSRMTAVWLKMGRV